MGGRKWGKEVSAEQGIRKQSERAQGTYRLCTVESEDEPGKAGTERGRGGTQSTPRGLPTTQSAEKGAGGGESTA